MRIFRFALALTASSLVLSLAVVGTPHASAQSVNQAEDEADEAKEGVDAASGLVGDAIAERAEIESELVVVIAKVNDLSAQLSTVGAGLDRLADQLGFADVELAGIKSQIEVQAVDAYMTVLASPTVTLVGSSSVEKALVASSVVEEVVSSGQEQVDALFTMRRSLEELQAQYLAQQAEYEAIQEKVNAEVEHLAELYEQADTAVATAVRQAQAADAEYRAALSAVDLARARAEERQRQESRSTTTTTTSPGASTTTTTTSPPTTPTSTPTTTTTTQGGGGGPWNHPPEVEQWRGLVQQFFPTHRVEEALRIIDCESNGDPEAYNPYSGASGLFQFLPSTWATTAPNAGYPGASPFDPEANIASAAWLANRYEELGHYYWQAWSCRRALD